MDNPTKLVIVKATGKKYLLKSEATVGKVIAWGELASFRGLSSKHHGTKTFLADAVEVKQVEKNYGLLYDLYEQGVQDLVAQGFIISRTRGGNVRIHGKRPAVY